MLPTDAPIFRAGEELPGNMPRAASTGHKFGAGAGAGARARGPGQGAAYAPELHTVAAAVADSSAIILASFSLEQNAWSKAQ